MFHYIVGLLMTVFVKHVAEAMCTNIQVLTMSVHYTFGVVYGLSADSGYYFASHCAVKVLTVYVCV